MSENKQLCEVNRNAKTVEPPYHSLLDSGTQTQTFKRCRDKSGPEVAQQVAEEGGEGVEGAQGGEGGCQGPKEQVICQRLGPKGRFYRDLTSTS